MTAWWLPWTPVVVGIAVTWWLMCRAKAADARRAAAVHASLDAIRRERLDRLTADRLSGRTHR